MHRSVYNQLSNNGNLAIYLSIARRRTAFHARGWKIIHFYPCIFVPAPRSFMPHTASHECHLPWTVFYAAKNLHSWRDLIFFLLFPEYVCKMHLWLFQKSTFWWHAARSEFFLRFFSVEKEHRKQKRAYAMATKGEEWKKKSHRESTHIAIRAIAKMPGLSSLLCMHGKNNIYGNN